MCVSKAGGYDTIEQRSIAGKGGKPSRYTQKFGVTMVNMLKLSNRTTQWS